MLSPLLLFTYLHTHARECTQIHTRTYIYTHARAYTQNILIHKLDIYNDNNNENFTPVTSSSDIAIS